MTPINNDGSYISKLTSALFEDSGWYLTNDIVSDVQEGANAGCDYFSEFETCNNNKFGDIFCDPE